MKRPILLFAVLALLALLVAPSCKRENSGQPGNPKSFVTSCMEFCIFSVTMTIAPPTAAK